MKLKLGFIVTLAVLAIGFGSTAFAFHSGGVADCAGCHSMHNTPSALPTGSPSTSATGGPMLLTGTDQSSTCLNCHASNSTTPGGITVMTWPFAGGTNVATVPVQRSPGGDFTWLLLSFTNTGHAPSNLGTSHGHNIVAVDYGLTASAVYTTAPGGTGFASASLYCNSCHDPHNKMRRDSNGAIQNMIGNTGTYPIIGSGSYPSSVTGGVGATAATVPTTGQAVGVYRILAGYNTYSAGGQTIPYAGVPIALAPKTYNQSEAAKQVRVAYGVGSGSNQVTWGAWCGTCHPAFVSATATNHYHPIDVALSSGNEASNYNLYVGSGNMTNSMATSYLSLTPFMSGTNVLTTLAPLADNTGTTAAQAGPGSSDQVSCLTCHRAHASGWTHGLRWNIEGEFITYVTGTGGPTWPGTDTTPTQQGYADGMLSTQVSAAYYDRTVAATQTAATAGTTFAPFQRSLCNKCHAQD